MSKVYVVVETWNCMSVGESGSCVEVFSTKEKAKQFIEKRQKEIKNEYSYNIHGQLNHGYTNYNKGCYSENYTDIIWEEKEVK